MGSRISSTQGYASAQATVSTTALTLITFGFSKPEVDAASRALIFVNTNSVRVDWSSNSPTVSLGAILTGVYDLFSVDNLASFEIIRDGASDSEVFIILEN